LSERKFINKLYELILKEKELGKHGWLRGVYKNKNLSTKEFQDIWSEWWKGRLPPRTEVDMILIFEDPMEALDKALIGCIEIEYFSTKDITKKNFYEGLQQVLAFSIFGFDGLCLWHMFSPEIEENVIVNYANTMGELISSNKILRNLVLKHQPKKLWITLLVNGLSIDLWGVCSRESSQTLDCCSGIFPNSLPKNFWATV
jgi:hypothetical protein